MPDKGIFGKFEKVVQNFQTKFPKRKYMFLLASLASFFSGVEVANTCLDEMEEFKGRDVAFVSDWLTKKVFKKSLLKTAGADDDCSFVGYDRQKRR